MGYSSGEKSPGENATEHKNRVILFGDSQEIRKNHRIDRHLDEGFGDRPDNSEDTAFIPDFKVPSGQIEEYLASLKQFG